MILRLNIGLKNGASKVLKNLERLALSMQAGTSRQSRTRAEHLMIFYIVYCT